MRVLLLEDEAPWADMVVESVRALGGAAIWTRTLDAFRDQLAGAGEFDVITMDRMLAGEPVDAVTALQQLRADHPDVPVMILSHLGGSYSTAEGLDLGADDYLAKPFDQVELTARLRALMRRSGLRPAPKLMTLGPLELWPKSRVAYYGAQRLTLSEQAFDVLRLLVENAGLEVSRQALWAEVWPQWVRVPAKSDVIEAAVYRLRQELRRAKAGDLIRTIPRVGYAIESP
jgi:DNA-binding response OmpR family regulator